MTVNSTIAKVTSNGNGAATRFPSSPVKFFREQDVSVTIVDTNGDETSVSLGTGPNAFAVDGDFTATNDTLVEADIIYPADEVTPLPSGWKIVIKREIPFTQTAIDLQNQGGYFPETQEKGFDLAMIGLIQLQEEVDRSVKVKIGSTVSTDQLSEDVQNVAASLSDVTTVATDLTGTDTIGTVATDLTGADTVGTVATNITNVNTTATNIAGVNTTATNITNVNTVATDLNLGSSSLVKIVADDLSGTDTVGTVAASITDVNTVAGISANVTTVATNITNVNTVATNITGVNSFAERYRVSTTNPSTSLDEGDLVFNTTDKVLRYYDGSTWSNISPGIAAVVADTTPQLGGNLDAQSNKITSLADPTAAQDASTKTYVDGITGRANTWTGTNTFQEDINIANSIFLKGERNSGGTFDRIIGVGTGDDTILRSAAGGEIKLQDNTPVTKAVFNFNASTPRLEVGGVSFDSGSNVLSEYEEGTYTPVLEGSSTTGTNSYTTQEGRYVIIGSTVHVWGEIRLDGTAGALNSTGLLSITLPIAISASAIALTGAAIGFYAGFSMPAGDVLYGLINGGGALALYHGDNTAAQFVTEVDTTDSLRVSFYVSYEI